MKPHAFPAIAQTLLLCFAAASPAVAHIVLAEPNFPSGVRYAAIFQVEHGCKGAPTTHLHIEIPAGVTVVTIPPKDGWTVASQSVPEKNSAQRRIIAVDWRGSLDAKEHGQFGLLLKLPDRTGPLYFPAIQTCETGENRWTDIPAAGQAWRDVPFPAPVVYLGPADPGMRKMDHMTPDHMTPDHMMPNHTMMDQAP